MAEAVNMTEGVGVGVGESWLVKVGKPESAVSPMFEWGKLQGGHMIYHLRR